MNMPVTCSIQVDSFRGVCGRVDGLTTGETAVFEGFVQSPLSSLDTLFPSISRRRGSVTDGHQFGIYEVSGVWWNE